MLGDAALGSVRIAGLSAHERALRVAAKAGASRVFTGPLDGLVAWRGDSTAPLLVLRGDQLVHPPLVMPLVETPGDLVSAVGPDGAYAGAFVARGAAAAGAIAALVRGDDDAAIAARASAKVPHGPIARHAIATPEEVRRAHALLYLILHKDQDNAITRYLFRPISRPLTKLLVWTPITPNQVSILVAILVAVGCWLTAHESIAMVTAGTATVLAATYVDCCDGEIARVKLLSSRFGAWVDTIVDEASSIAYMLALGWHCHLHYGRDYFGDIGFDPWLACTAISLVTYLGCVYFVYYNIIVAVGSANSQDYVARFDAVPGDAPQSVILRPRVQTSTRTLPPLLAAIAAFVPNVARRDFIVWLATLYAVLHLTQVSFATHVVGGLVTCVVLGADHVHLRRLRRSIARAGQHVDTL